ncbi:MAG: hypothetical protein MZV63_61595 [Marinilabiliales bacterium]|nr:hypothetical protein [Marinilabiliales bacterium]
MPRSGGFCQHHPDVAGYVIYTFSGGTANAIDTVRSPSVTMVHSYPVGGQIS